METRGYYYETKHSVTKVIPAGRVVVCYISVLFDYLK